jgi:hypothetical protein
MVESPRDKKNTDGEGTRRRWKSWKRSTGSPGGLKHAHRGRRRARAAGFHRIRIMVGEEHVLDYNDWRCPSMIHWVMTFLTVRRCTWCLQSCVGWPVTVTQRRGGHGGIWELKEKKKRGSWWRLLEGERQLGFQSGWMERGLKEGACWWCAVMLTGRGSHLLRGLLEKKTRGGALSIAWLSRKIDRKVAKSCWATLKEKGGWFGWVQNLDGKNDERGKG